MSDDDIKKIQLQQSIKDLSKKTIYPTNKVYSMATNSLNLYQLPLIPKKSVYKNMQNSRKRNSINVNIESNLLIQNIKSLRDENIVLYDSGSNDVDRLIIFTTNTNFIHLNNAKVWISDGTFKCFPREFSQLYIIFEKVFKKDFHLVFMLMKSRTELAYTRSFNVLKEHNVKFPDFLIIDFKIQAFNAVKKISNNINIKFCLFHFGQCIWRRIQYKGLTKLNINNVKFKLYRNVFYYWHLFQKNLLL